MKEDFIIGDVYHWETDLQGNLQIEENLKVKT